MDVLLLVSPEEALQQVFGQCAKRLAHAFVGVQGVRQAQRMMARLRVDMLCLDTMLDDHEIDRFAAWLDADPARSSIPVLYVAPRLAEVIPGVLPFGFRPDVDGCISRPLEADKLGAQISRLLAGGAGETRPAEVVRAGELSLNLRSYQLYFPDSSALLLTPTEFRLVRFLMERPGSFVHPEEIVEQVWGYRPDAGGLAVVRAHVANIRRKLRGLGKDAGLLRGVPYRGYCLALEAVEVGAPVGRTA